jgi:hypothetical protein
VILARIQPPTLSRTTFPPHRLTPQVGAPDARSLPLTMKKAPDCVIR